MSRTLFSLAGFQVIISGRFWVIAELTLVRINDLARELEVKSKSILDALPLVGVLEKKTHSSSLEEQEAEKVRAYLRRQGPTAVAGIRESNLGEQEIKTRIDLSHISRPGEVLRAILQQQRSTAPARAQSSSLGQTPKHRRHLRNLLLHD
jgi:translation initiation factor IF-2